MANKGIDGIVDAVHYQQDGSIDTVRYYEHRGSVWSDTLLLDRASLLLMLKNGRNFVTGSRKRLQGSVFQTSSAIRCEGRHILSGAAKPDRDHLDDVPVF